jgi:hypothetical protein
VKVRTVGHDRRPALSHKPDPGVSAGQVSKTLNAAGVLTFAPTLQYMNHDLLPHPLRGAGQVISAWLCIFAIDADRTISSPPALPGYAGLTGLSEVPRV